ncbi:MAG TPA: hypothetical protein VLS87_01975 [Woeseiaceae bacterium]|nr:hypothetical protein [Woeseiaceae bacterium]
MKAGVLGAGVVGKVLAAGFAGYRHEVLGAVAGARAIAPPCLPYRIPGFTRGQ